LPYSLNGKLVVALSSRALFDFEEENRFFEQADDRQYMALQLQRLEQPAGAGVAYPLVKKLLAFNSDGEHRVEVVILSRNDPVSGLRVFRSASALGLNLTRGVFTRGAPPYGYLKPLGAHLFLSSNESDVNEALANQFPAARVFNHSVMDAVLFSDEAERVFQRDGLDAFQTHEADKALQPLGDGPLKPLLEALHNLQNTAGNLPVKIRTALVTARSAPAHERAIRTLMSWNISVDEAMFLGGLEKGPFLQSFEPDFFFDDQLTHCESGVHAGPTAHVIPRWRKHG
jgi:5'-nucleotidase